MISVLLDKGKPDEVTEMDETLLQKREDVVDNDEYHFDITEYCLLGCTGQAHQTGVAQGDGCFCELHVHRSIAGQIKRWPVEAGAEAASL